MNEPAFAVALIGVLGELVLGLVALHFKTVNDSHREQIQALREALDDETDKRERGFEKQGERVGNAESDLRAHGRVADERAGLAAVEAERVRGDIANHAEKIVSLQRKLGSEPAMPAMRPRLPSRGGGSHE